MEERQPYFAANPFKFLAVGFNLLVLLAGLALSHDLAISAAIFMSLIGVQFHFTVFEDLRDRHLLNRLDLVLSLGTLVILFVKFFMITATAG